MTDFSKVQFKGTFRDYQRRVLDNADKYLKDGKINIQDAFRIYVVAEGVQTEGFDTAIEALNMNRRCIGVEIQKEMSSEEKTQLDNLNLLEERVSRLALQYRQNLYSILKQAKLEPDNRKRIDLTNDCYSMYEIAFRREIVDSLYTPQVSLEITKYIDLRNKIQGNSAYFQLFFTLFLIDSFMSCA